MGLREGVGRHVPWRFQGIKNSCWLTSIEMLMQSKHGTIYGKDQNGNPRTQHSALAMQEFRANRGSSISLHAEHYGLATNAGLDSPGASWVDWATALRRGPVLAEGKYGWARFGVGSHVILVTGMSESGKLIYMNPNIHAVLPHPLSKETYIDIEDLNRLRHQNFGGHEQGPFWQVKEDLLPHELPALNVGYPDGWEQATQRQVAAAADRASAESDADPST
jgi:hypothetical protein